MDAGDDPVTGDVSREHWTVPVSGRTRADPDGVVQAIAGRDGTVSLRVTCGDTRITVQFDVSRAAQISTGIWEAAGASQHLNGYRGDSQPPPPPQAPGELPAAWHSSTHHAAPRRRSYARRPRRLSPVTNDAARDTIRTIGLRIRRIRGARDKSLSVIGGLAGMSSSTLHRIEHGQRELTLSEIIALAGALQIAPAKLIALPIFASGNRQPDATKEAVRTSST